MRHLRAPRQLPVVFVVAAFATVACSFAGRSPTAPLVLPGGAAQPTTSYSTASPLAEPAESPPAVVVIDPGHNGLNASHPDVIARAVPNGRGGTKACNTTGTATDAGYAEHAFNMDVALRVREELTASGVRVVLTRPDDNGVGPCVDRRAAIANELDADALVSIHADGTRRTGRGYHVIHSEPPLNLSQGPLSVSLAQAIVEALAGRGFGPANYVGSAGLDARSDIAGLNLSEVPAVLVECANMRNPDEAAVLSTVEGRARYAKAIADGVLRWVTEDR